MENQKEWNEMVRREAKRAPQPALADERAVWQAMCAICTVDQINKITDYVLSRRAAQPAESTQHQEFVAEEALINPEKPWGFSENIQVLPEQHDATRLPLADDLELINKASAQTMVSIVRPTDDELRSRRKEIIEELDYLNGALRIAAPESSKPVERVTISRGGDCDGSFCEVYLDNVSQKVFRGDDVRDRDANRYAAGLRAELEAKR